MTTSPFSHSANLHVGVTECLFSGCAATRDFELHLASRRRIAARYLVADLRGLFRRACVGARPRVRANAVGGKSEGCHRGISHFWSLPRSLPRAHKPLKHL